MAQMVKFTLRACGRAQTGMKFWPVLRRGQTSSIVLSRERSQTQKAYMSYDPIYVERSRTGNSAEAQSRSVVAKAWEEGKWG